MARNGPPMKQTWFLLPVLASASLLAVTSAQAQLDAFSVGYNLHPYGGQAAAPPDATDGFTDPNVNLSNTRLGSGYNALGQPQNDPSAYGVYPGVNNVYGTTPAQAFGYNEYLSFTLTPAAGQTVSLGQLQFGVSLPDQPGAPALEYSTNGTAFTEMDPTSTTGDGTSGTNASGGGSTMQGTFDLSAVAALQNLASGTTVTFDLLLYCPTYYAPFQGGVYDDSKHDANGLDIEVDGTAIPTPAPEPSTWAMMAAGAGLLLMVQRKRRTA